MLIFPEALTPITERTADLIRRRFPFVVFIALAGLFIFVWNEMRTYKQIKMERSIQALVPRLRYMSPEQRGMIYFQFFQKHCARDCHSIEELDRITARFEAELRK